MTLYAGTRLTWNKAAEVITENVAHFTRWAALLRHAVRVRAGQTRAVSGGVSPHAWAISSYDRSRSAKA